jgi:hypothetical protein
MNGGLLSQTYNMAFAQIDQTTKPQKALTSLVTATMIYQTFGKQQK